MHPPVESMGSTESVAEQGHLFRFVVDDVYPDVPHTARPRHYYVVSRDPSRARAYCYLLLSLCELSDRTRLSRWMALYSHLFGEIDSELFFEMLRGLARACTFQYAFFVDENVARLALSALTRDEALTPCERHGGEPRKHELQTLGGAGTTAAMESIADADRQRHVEADLLHGRAAPGTSLAEHTQLEDRSRETQLLLQLEHSQHEREVAALREAMTAMEQKLIWHEQAHQYRLRHHRVQHQGGPHRLEREMQQHEAELYRDQGPMLRDQERLIQQLSEENAFLQRRHRESGIEAEHWRTECQELRHRLNNTLMTASCPLNSVSREHYGNLEKRHQLLHREFDELSLERSEMERQLQQARQELHQRCVERDNAVRVLDSLRRGLDYVGRRLPLLCGMPATCAARNLHA
ncbi:uncharacterized protein Tco025E_06824 [Trypanosoma conorhini]|uniref:Prp19 coiled-coil region domain-containing protein n=1 Tax=Trypanosoma conorhini TaxID=83891 RepID=A0A3R7KUX7_9TRYP|nr:uncharacterized protein Tco025E_06824 [Trypanosoma conorhini]RNF10258.1 hypothetical protein Tco025E_06824 [Trypanosoma conorhini]